MGFRVAPLTQICHLHKMRKECSHQTSNRPYSPTEKFNNFRLVDTSPLVKWKDEIRRFSYQTQDAYLPYFVRNYPWLKVRFLMGKNLRWTSKYSQNGQFPCSK